MNLYAYAGNDPISYTDPFGLCPPISDCIAKAWGGIKAAADAVATYVGSHPEIQAAIVASTTGDPGEEDDAVDEEVAGSALAGSGSASGQSTSSSTTSSGATPSSPNFVVTSGGTAIPVPEGASGPVPVVNSSGQTTGTAYTGGSGGANGQVSSVRIMNPTPARGSAPAYPNGYVKYENSRGQGVDPTSGRTVPNSQSHYPIPK